MKFLLIITILVAFAQGSFAEGQEYQCRKDNNHVIHILTLHPSKYSISFIKARNQVIGRETIESIAKRTGADFAINGGFFEIGEDQDGMPSGTLIINKQIYALKFQNHACLVYDQNQFKIQSMTPSLKIRIGNNTFYPKKVNKASHKNDVVLYTHLWGPRTLTPLKERQEIAINDDFKVVEVSAQGNCAIPQNGLVLSLPIHSQLTSIHRDDGVLVQLDPLQLSKPEKQSVVMGIPILLQAGKLNPSLNEQKSPFYQSPHARTALGIRPNGELVIVVAEHVYKKPMPEVTMEDVKSLLSKNKAKIVSKYQKPLLNTLTLDELKEIVAQELTGEDGVKGLTLAELGTLMKDLGCESAINLDGGGSSSLFVHDKVVNKAVGDQDENMGQTTSRPVSDAIVFKLAS